MKACVKHDSIEHARCLIIGISALLLSACGEEPESVAKTTPTTTLESSVNEASNIETPTPYITFTLRGMVEKRIEVGEPLFVSVRIEAPDEDSATMPLSPASGGWVDHVAVIMLKSDTVAPLMQAKPTEMPDASPVSLQGEQAATGMWYFSSAQTQQLTPGDYQVQVRLAINNGNGWTGETESHTQSLQVVTGSEQGAIQRTIALANEAIFNNTPEVAARFLDAQLENTPDNIRLLTLRAKVSSRAGNYTAAMQCVQRALQLAEIEGWTQPPLTLVIMETELNAALFGGAPADAATLPEWSQAPKAALGRLEPAAPKTIGATDDATALEPIVPVATAASGAGTDTRLETVPLAAAPIATAATTASSTVTPDQAPALINNTNGANAGTVIPPADLDETRILADPNGQWASGARAGSEYGPDSYGAVQMIGAPDVPGAGGDNGSAWAHSSASVAQEWIELDYAKPVHATEVRIRQTNAPGTIIKVEAIEPNGTAHTWWEGVDPYMPPDDIDLVWFAVRVPATAYLAAKMKVTLDLATRPGWKEIDAVQLVGTAR